jgi:hypothetical protein
MAITINANPSGTPTVQDNLWHVATSTNSSESNFKFIVEVYVNGERTYTGRHFPEPSTGKLYFDAAPAVRNMMTYQWFEPTNVDAYQAQPNVSGEMGVTYQVRVGEDFSGVSTTNLASSQTTAYNWVAPLFQRRVATLQDRLNKWLTNRPLTIRADFGENIFIPFYTNTALTLKCFTYDASNNTISTYTGSATTITNGFAQMNIGTNALNAELGIPMDSNVAYYDVWFNSLDKVRVYIDCNNKYTPILCHFVNRWGMYDTMRFSGVSKLMMDVERKGFERKDYNFNGTAVEYMSAANRYYESKINYSNKMEWGYKLNTDNLTDAEFQWAEELIYSPQILLEVDGYYYPVTIKNNNYEQSKYVNNKMKNLEIDFELNQTRRSHLR